MSEETETTSNDEVEELESELDDSTELETSVESEVESEEDSTLDTSAEVEPVQIFDLEESQDETALNAAPTVAPPPSEPPVDEVIEVVTAPAAEGEQSFPWLHVLATAVITALGCFGIFALFSDSLLGRVTVDNYVGLDLEEVETLLAESDVVIETELGREDGTSPGEVIDQLPRAGGTLDQGDVLRLTISEGSQLREIPEVVGLAPQDAIALLENRGFEAGEVVEERDSATVARGSIVELVVDGDAIDGDLPTGTAIDFVVSTGLVTIPRVTQDEIQSVLVDQLRLNVTTEERFDENLEPGTVSGTQPATGTKVVPGSDITVFIATEEPPQQIQVPDVRGQTVEQAVERLRRAGFQVSLNGQNPADCDGGIFNRPSAECRWAQNGRVWRFSPTNRQVEQTQITILAPPEEIEDYKNSVDDDD